MRPLLKRFLFLAPVLLLLASCGSKKASVLVPKDAAMVVHINMASLSSKLPWSEIKNGEFFKMVTSRIEDDEELTPFQQGILENPENAGINFKSDVYFFLKISGRNAYAVVIGDLSDSKKFEAALKSAGEMMRFKKDGSINYIGNDDGCLTWNEHKFIIVTPSEAPNNDLGPRRRYYNERENELEFDSLLHFAKNMYGLKQSNSISSDAHFSSLMKEAGDMHMLFNSNSFMGDAMGALSMLKASELLEGNATGLAINFDNGKITANAKSWYSKALGELMKKFQPGNLNTDMLKRIPSEDLAAVLAFNYPPEGIKEFLKALGADGMVNMAIGEVGLTIDDFVKANKGDVMLAVSDFALREKKFTYPMGDGKDYTYSTTRPDANILFATSVNDKTSFNKLLDAVKNEMNKQGGRTEDTSQIKYTLTDKWFVMGNEQAAIDNFAAGTNTNSAALISQISGHPMGGFIDLQKIFAGIAPPTDTNKVDDAPGVNEMILLAAAKNWENIIFYGGEMKDGAAISHLEINLKDKSTNSLKQLYNFFGNVIEAEMKQKRRMYDEEMEIPPAVMDSAVMVPETRDRNK